MSDMNNPVVTVEQAWRAEVERLTRERDGLAKAEELYRKGMESQCELMDGLKQENRRMEAEIARLKRGDFIEEEFQALCHNFSEDDACRFKKGCEEYQRKLFGDKV